MQKQRIAEENMRILKERMERIDNRRNNHNSNLKPQATSGKTTAEVEQLYEEEKQQQ